jgi:hypothetical protein
MYHRLCSEGTVPAEALSTFSDTFCGKTASGDTVMVRYPRKGRGLSVDVGSTTVGKNLSKEDAAALASKHAVTSPWMWDIPADECKKTCEAAAPQGETPTAEELYRKMKHLPYRQGGIDMLTKAGFHRTQVGQAHETWEGTTVDGHKQMYQWIAQTQSGVGTMVFGWSRISSDASESVSQRNAVLYEALDIGKTGKCKECGRREELLNGLCRSCSIAADDKAQAMGKKDDEEKEESLAEPTDAEYTNAVERLNASLRKGTVRD